ncbi:hypothetical protein GBAR_LOCUS31618 [Geodia barretti]|uniref:Uncharacterized protein n=1 Tax=Geodia barretti TaxID=519541 RepID=A0AA35XM23_GEOBA|nr:hypothetical protein GBAR_LOCUS31618 [Geodia barretti]
MLLQTTCRRLGPCNFVSRDNPQIYMVICWYVQATKMYNSSLCYPYEVKLRWALPL